MFYISLSENKHKTLAIKTRNIRRIKTTNTLSSHLHSIDPRRLNLKMKTKKVGWARAEVVTGVDGRVLCDYS